MSTHLFLASTPFNAIVSSMIAFDLPSGSKSYLWLIDQTETTTLFRECLYQWKESPFLKIETVSYKARSLREKMERKKNLREILEKAEEIQPSNIYTGNDRRIEFQWLMSKLKTPNGHYIDDGLYTYNDNPSTISDRIIDNAIKKIFYGTWWQQPKTIGASNLISTCHVAWPEEANYQLKKKHLVHLPNNLRNSSFNKLLTPIQNLIPDIKKADAIVILPHNSTKSIDWNSEIEKILYNNASVLIKRHPRSTESLTGKISELTEIPGYIPIELLLPMLNASCNIIGEESTALLTGKWLRPDCNVTAFCQKRSRLTDLMNKMQINIKF